jgi:hypothetical protein
MKNDWHTILQSAIFLAVIGAFIWIGKALALSPLWLLAVVLASGMWLARM